MNKLSPKEIIARRAALELEDGDLVNLGIGLPTMVPTYLPKGVNVITHSENGIVGVGPRPTDEEATDYVVDAGGQKTTCVVGGAFIDSSVSFGLIRGGHIDAALLGAMEVDQHGGLANWIIPGKKLPGMGGAMDLVVGARKVIITMEHTVKGNHKILDKCKLPYTAEKCVNLIITEMGVMKVTDNGLELTEYNPDYTVEDIKAATGCTLIVSPDLKPML